MKRVIALVAGVPVLLLCIVSLWLYSKVFGEPGLID